MDILTSTIGLLSFAVFLLVQVITFRWVRPEYLLRSLLICVAAIGLLPLAMTAVLFHMEVIEASVPVWVCAGLLASAINALLCFVYVLCVFGPYETSVRMRLVRELEQGRQMTLEQLLKRYNSQTIVDVRLRRLVGSGDIVETQGLYHCGRKGNFFFVFDAIASILKKWIGGAP
jgi:hypothetical protein